MTVIEPTSPDVMIVNGNNSPLSAEDLAAILSLTGLLATTTAAVGIQVTDTARRRREELEAERFVAEQQRQTDLAAQSQRARENADMNARMRAEAQQAVILEVQVSEAYKEWQAHVAALMAEYHTRMERGQQINSAHTIHEQALEFINGVNGVIDQYGNFMTSEERQQLQEKMIAYQTAYDEFNPKAMIEHVESLGELYTPIATNVEARYSHWAITQAQKVEVQNAETGASNWMQNLMDSIAGLISSFIPNMGTNIFSGIFSVFSQNLLLPTILGSIAVIGLGIGINTIDFSGINHQDDEQILYVDGVTPEIANCSGVPETPTASLPVGYTLSFVMFGAVFTIPQRSRKKQYYHSLVLIFSVPLLILLSACSARDCITAGNNITIPEPANANQEVALESAIHYEAGFDCEPTATACNCNSPATVISAGVVTGDGVWLAGHFAQINDPGSYPQLSGTFATNPQETISNLNSYECVEFSGANGTISVPQDALFSDASILIDFTDDV